jgi:hypothetical protein
MLIVNRLESQTIKKYFGTSKAKGHGQDWHILIRSLSIKVRGITMKITIAMNF